MPSARHLGTAIPIRPPAQGQTETTAIGNGSRRGKAGSTSLSTSETLEALAGLTLFPFLRNLPHHIIRPVGVDKENLDSTVTADLHPQPGLNRREFNVWLSGLRGFDKANDNLRNARRLFRRVHS